MKKKSGTYFWLWFGVILLFIIGGVLIYKTSLSNMDNILFNIGVSMISTAIITILLSIGNQYIETTKESNIVQECSNTIRNIFSINNKLLYKFYEFGIVDTFFERKKSYDENEKIGRWENFLRYNEDGIDYPNEINIMGINLDGIFKLAKLDDNYVGDDILERNDLIRYERLEILAKEIEHGATVNVIIPDYYDSLFLRCRSLTENIQVPEKRWEKRINANIKILCRLKSVLGEEEKKRLNIYKYNNIMYYFFFQRRNMMFISNYLGYSPGDECPANIYKYIENKDSLYNKYLNDFNEIKKKAAIVDSNSEIINAIIDDCDNDKLCLYSDKIVESKEKNQIEVYVNKENCISTIKSSIVDYPSVHNIRNSKNEKRIIGNVLLSSGIILFINNKLLLMKRGEDAQYDPSMWTTPAGRCDRDIEYTAFKEFYEEVYFIEKNKPIFIKISNLSVDYDSLKQIYYSTVNKNQKTHQAIREIFYETEEVDWLKETLCIQKARESAAHTIGQEKNAKMFYFFDEEHNTLEFRKIVNIKIKNINELQIFDGEYKRDIALFDMDEIINSNEKYVKCIEVMKNIYSLYRKTT